MSPTAVALAEAPAAAAPAAVSTPAKKLALPNNKLEQLIAATPACLLRPLRFFVSWQGVLTLAYSGFPPALAALKRDINEQVSGLPAEYSGSKWPKTSLGALRDRARLTPEQLQRLNTICSEVSAALDQEAERQAVLVDTLKVVFYECRCLERRLLEHRVAMAGPAAAGAAAVDGPLAAAAVDVRHPDPEELQRVAAVVGEADTNPDYWFLASKDGSREGHYRSSYLGVTLVHDIVAFRGAADSGSTTISSSDSANGKGNGNGHGSCGGNGHSVDGGNGNATSAHGGNGNGDSDGIGAAGNSHGADGGSCTLSPHHAHARGHVYGADLPGLVSAFRRRVDAELPGMYTWFDDTSLHVTIRSLMG